MTESQIPATEAGRRTPEEAVEAALLYVFQLSDKDYRKMQTAMSEIAFMRALAQDGYAVLPIAIEAEPPALDVERALALVYAHGYDVMAPVAVAAVCDEVLDRSGAMLGRIRSIARAYAKDRETTP